MLKGKLGVQQFLDRYWQRKPVLLKQAFPEFTDLCSPEALAGLACEEDVESRLVFSEQQNWRLQSGPFCENDFLSLPEKDWTLLVQTVDHWLPEVKKLLQSVDFLPSWRVDDVMISYATAGGGVGPHFDYYDVFLVQGQGSRRWRTGQHCTAQDIVRSESGLKLLQDFNTENDFLLHSGDVLYIPPGVAHWGVSVDNSLSYSIGFRAPSLTEMLYGFSDYLSDQCNEDLRFSDPRLPATLKRGEIDTNSLSRAHKLVLSAMQDKEIFARWFGEAMTEPRNADSIVPRKRITPTLATSTHYQVHPAARLAWQQQDDSVVVFCNGSSSTWKASTALYKLLQQLCLPGAEIPARLFGVNSDCRKLRDQLLQDGNLLKATSS